MKSLLRYVYSVKEKLSSLNLSDDMDTLIDNELVVDIINDVNTGLMQEAWRNNMITPDLYTPTCCLEVKCAPESECVIAGLTVPTTGLIHYVELENLVPGIPMSTVIRYLGLSNYQNPIYIAENIMNWATWEHRNASRNKPVGYLIGNRMYLKNMEYFTSSVTFLCMLALIAKPQNMCDVNDDTPYRTPNPQKLEYLAFQQLAIALGQRAGDEVNNTNADNSGEQRKAVNNQRQEQE